MCRRSSGVVSLAPPLTALITPEPVRHSRIPDLPLDSNLLFEALLFLYLLVALFVQYINIYRTVWWSSYSHPSASTSLVQSNIIIHIPPSGEHIWHNVHANDFWHKIKMGNFEPYYIVLLAIVTNIAVLLMTVLQGHR